MPSMVFKPGDIDSNSSEIVLNDTDIDSNSSDIVVNDGDIDTVSGAADSASSDAVSAASDASDAVVAADTASGVANSASSDVDVIEADDKYAKSIYSDPSSGSYAIIKIDVPSGSDAIFIDYSSSAAE